MIHRNTIFRQLLQLIDRNTFDAIELEGFLAETKMPHPHALGSGQQGCLPISQIDQV